MASLRLLLLSQLSLLAVCAAPSSALSTLTSFSGVVSLTSSDVGISSFTPSTSTSVSSVATSTISDTATSSFTPSASTITSAPGTIVTTLSGSGSTASLTFPTSASFIPIGSIPRNYTPETLEELWNLVGEVAEPPFTTTVAVQTTVILPSSPPPLYPTWYATSPADILSGLKLPSGFKFGVATAAYQVEGAVKLEGKGPTGWDWAGHKPGTIADGTTADIVDLQYLLYKEDTARVAALGINAHSFSISWSRIFPFGTKDSPVNQAGLDHYSDLIDYSNSLGVQPVVTLFHWDLPLALAAFYGGATSEEFVDDYVNYATTVFKAYNGRVKTWYTFNEPHVYCSQLPTYPFNSTLSANVTSFDSFYHCGYYLLKAHARAVKAFRDMGIEGEIAYKNDGSVGRQWRANSTEDAQALERNIQFYIGMFAEPVYNTGDWPELMKQTLNESILPRFTDEDKALLKGSADFFATDLYTSAWIAAPENGIEACIADSNDPNWPACNVQQLYDAGTGWPVGIAAELQATWLRATPQNVRHELQQMKKLWSFDKVYISEFGFIVPEEGVRPDIVYVLDDADRTNYYMTYLGEALLAIHEDGIPLEGVFCWSMVDNAEWNSGENSRFGIQYVNYTSLERHYKRSAMALSEFYAAHKS